MQICQSEVTHMDVVIWTSATQLVCLVTNKMKQRRNVSILTATYLQFEIQPLESRRDVMTSKFLYWCLAGKWITEWFDSFMFVLMESSSSMCSYKILMEKKEWAWKSKPKEASTVTVVNHIHTVQCSASHHSLPEEMDGHLWELHVHEQTVPSGVRGWHCSWCGALPLTVVMLQHDLPMSGQWTALEFYALIEFSLLRRDN